MRIGIDVGGTNTDAVLMDGLRVVAQTKAPTTPDVLTGIVATLRTLIRDSLMSTQNVRAVMIGTTHFTNAVVEGRRLERTAAVRLGLPATAALPPMTAWPARLRAAVGDHVYLCHGGHEFDGREIAPLDPDELARVADDIASRGLRTVAISSVFSPINAEFERRAAEIIARRHPEAAISLSHEIGRIGLLERENATILNASLRPLAHHIVGAFQGALSELAIDAPVFLSQNDGTLMAMEVAKRFPVATFASGPTNSMRGAALLSGQQACAVVDIGGTTADIGILQNGFPREASLAVDVGDVRTNFRMPDVLSLGIGGGSIIRSGPETTVGPDSVGYEIERRALIFGGDTLTASDLAVADGRADFGDPGRVRGLNRELVRTTLDAVERRVAEAIDRMKLDPEPIPVVLVGGGSILLRDRLQGARSVVRPDHFAVANAIGAAIAQVSGEVERVVSLAAVSRDEAVAQAKQDAAERALAAGARGDTIRVIDVEEVGLAYLPGNATRIKVRAVGDLELGEVSVATAV